MSNAETPAQCYVRWLADRIPTQRTLFYLDAHWGPGTPLREEIETISRSWESSVVVFDDFAVEDDPAYGFDRLDMYT